MLAAVPVPHHTLSECASIPDSIKTVLLRIKNTFSYLHAVNLRIFVNANDGHDESQEINGHEDAEVLER